MKKIIAIAGVVGLMFLGSTSTAFSLAVTDVTLEGDYANAYYSPAGAVVGNTSEAVVNASITENWVWDDSSIGPIGGDLFTLLAKSDGLEGSLLNDFDFSVSAVVGTSGTYELSWTGGMTPATFDLIFGLKASNYYALYYFEGFEIISTPSSASGTYLISFSNPGGQTPDLSHLDVYGRTGTAPVPEPTTLLLFGTGLLGLAGLARRKRN